jgi:hypothetical protein
MKYDRTNGNFDHKLTIFEDVCQRVDLLKEVFIRAFPTMLKGLVQDLYYNTYMSKLTYVDAYNKIRNFFEGLKYQRSNLVK